MDFAPTTRTKSGQHGGGPNHEDWEDWLRWDPAAEPTSPNDTFNSGSSKNDSPLQDPSYPVQAIAFGKTNNDTLMSPLIVGDETLGFGAGEGLTDDPIPFGASGSGQHTFDFGSSHAFNHEPRIMPRLDTNAEAWTIPGAIADPNVTLSALPTDHHHYLPSASSYTATTPSVHHSPNSATSGKRASLESSSPETTNPPKKRGGRKRKAEVQQESPQDGENGDSQDGDGPPVKKTSHNVIEKRYRNNLNDKIVELRNSVPSLRAMGRATVGEDSEDLEGLTPAHKLNKATVMAKATEYIRHLEKRNTAMGDEMDALKARLTALEAVISGNSSDRQSSFGASPPTGMLPSGDVSSHSQNGSPSFLNVTQDQARYGQPVPQQYMQQQTPPTYARPPNPPVHAQNQPQHVQGRGGVINKVMMGTMAGLMVMEGFTEQQDSSEYSLASIPTALFRRGADDAVFTTATHLSTRAMLSLLKVALLLGCMLYLLAPLLSFSPRRKQTARSAVQLPQAPSLASPVEVRRKAWSTAIQTVWAPKHFLLEVVTVSSKMIQLSLRRLIGSEAFTSVTGTTKEEEAARIKAWDIAIDAQLAGGDAEVSYYRLLLTLMESGTLPDSPARLMQKAVHFRVFFWEMANAGYGNLIGFKLLTEKVGKLYWDSARRLQKELVHARAQGRPSTDEETELLPDHLARLGELDCEEVLSDEMIQRAWNLAWNKPSAYRAIANAARDSVVEDHAIHSPLDAVAAWYTNTLIDETLADTLGETTSTFDTEYYIGLALSVAPPASNTHVRALAAKAVLSSSNRDSNIIAALEALPVTWPTGGINLVSHAPASPDVCNALTIAKLISLCSPSSLQAGRARGLEAVRSLHFSPSQHSLLTAVAVFRLLRLLTYHTRPLPGTEHAMEDLAAGLRVWVGSSAGVASGLSHVARGRLVALCVKVAKKVGGWTDRDSGYGSVEQSPRQAKAVLCM